MRSKKILYFVIPIVMILIVGITFYFRTDDAEAAYTHNYERVDQYIDTDGQTIYVYDLYVEVTQNSSFNHVEAQFETVGLEVVDFELQEDFVAESLDLGTGSGGSYSITSNTIYTSDSGKIVYAKITLKTIGAEECYMELFPSKPSVVTTNDVSISKISVATQDSPTELQSVEDDETFYYKITIQNQSPIPTDNLVITDSIPDDFEILNAYSGDVIGQNITWEIPSLDVAETAELLVQVRVKEDDNRTNFNITNTAVVTINGVEKEATSSIEILKPNLTITKETTDDNVRPNEQFSYNIIVTNTGEGTARNVIVTDSIPENFTIVSSSITNNGSGNNMVFELGNLAHNESTTITINVRVNDTSSFETVNNVASVSADNNSSVSDNALVTISDSNLTIVKNASSTTARPGDEYTYTIVVTNEGQIDSNSFTITDTIDSRLEIVSAPGANIAGQEVTFNGSGLAPTEKQEFTITVLVKETAPISSSINNIAILQEEGKTEKRSEEEVTIADSSVTINKTANKTEVRPNEEFEYTIEVSNSGGASSRDLTITDAIDSRLEIVSAPEAEINGSTLTWHIASLASNDNKIFKVVVKAKSDIADNTTINNVVTLKETGKQDQTDSDDVFVKRPILSITKTAINDEGNSVNIEPGETFNYTITIRNSGTIASGNIVVTDAINPLLTIVDSADGIVSNNTITWNIDSLGVDESITYRIRVKLANDVGDTNQITNTAVLTHNGESQSASDTIYVVDSDIYIVKMADVEAVKVDDEFAYTILIGNNGTNSEENLVLVDDVPDTLEILDVEYRSSKITHSNDNNKITFNITDINIAESFQITLRVKAKNNIGTDESIINTAILTYDDHTKEASSEVLTIAPNLTIEKESNKDKVLNSEHFNYTITIKNNGTASAENIQIIDTFDENLTIVDCDECTISNNTLTWNIANIDASETYTFTIEAYIENQPNGYIINNKAVLKEPNKPDKTSEVNVEVIDYNITIEKEVSDTQVYVGEEFKYSIIVRNESSVAISNVVINDIIDENLIIVDNDSAVMSNNNLTWEIALLANEEIVIEIIVKPKDTAAGVEISNTATLTYNDEDTPSNEVVVEIIEDIEDIPGAGDTPNIDEDVENPSTGSTVDYILLSLGIIGIIGIGVYTKKHKKIYKI